MPYFQMNHTYLKLCTFLFSKMVNTNIASVKTLLFQPFLTTLYIISYEKRVKLVVLETICVGALFFV